MNNTKIIGGIGGVAIAVIILGIILMVNLDSEVAEVEDTFDKEIQPVEIPEIQDKLDKIEQIANSTDYKQLEREWITSGPFKIDRSEYLIGEKIFVNIDALSINEKGKVVFLRPINNTHYLSYHTMPFDGSSQRNNYYFTPDLSIPQGICNTEALIGNWKVVFQGTKYLDLKFKVIEEIIPGYEERYEPKC